MRKNSIYEYIILAICSSILTVSKFLMSYIPNIEPVTLLIIIYTLIFGFKRTMIITIIFVLIEGYLWGFDLWVISYIFVWPLLVIITQIIKNKIKNNFMLWSLFAGFYGMIFGILCAIPLIIFDKSFAYSTILSGIFFDAVHMVGNYLIMLIVGETFYNRLKEVIKELNLNN